jgi:S1-C subfamily serine protease
MRSSNWIKLGGLAILAASLVLSGVFSVQAGPLGQATAAASQAATVEPTQAATAEPTKVPTVEPTKAPTVEPTQAPTVEPTKAATVEPTKAATKYPPCPGSSTMGTVEPTAAATTDATAAATQAEFTPGYLGIAGETVDSCGTKVIVVEPDGPADKAGLKLDDIVVAADNTAYGSVEAFSQFIKSNVPGTKVELVIKRGGDELTITVALGTRPAQTPPTVAPEATKVPTAEPTSEPTAKATAGQ